jgi:hypothetical protein
MSLLAERHGRHREVDDCAYGRTHLLQQDRLAASFFFFLRGGGDVGNASKFVATISVQLAMHILPVQRYIRDVLTERSVITDYL